MSSTCSSKNINPGASYRFIYMWCIQYMTDCSTGEVHMYNQQLYNMFMLILIFLPGNMRIFKDTRLHFPEECGTPTDSRYTLWNIWPHFVATDFSHFTWVCRQQTVGRQKNVSCVFKWMSVMRSPPKQCVEMKNEEWRKKSYVLDVAVYINVCSVPTITDLEAVGGAKSWPIIEQWYILKLWNGNVFMMD